MTKTVLLGDLLEICKESLSPGKEPKTEFYVYSIPGYDSGKPERLLGSEIMSNKFVVYPRSILVSKINPRIPRVWRVDKTGPNSISSTEFVVLRVKSEYRNLFDFIYAVMSSAEFSIFLKSRVKGTSGSHQRIKPEDIYEYAVIINDKASERIGDFVLTIDKKIELNRRMNETLEKMGHAIFRHRFTDNPDAEKWKNGIVGDLGEVITGKTPDKSKSEFYGPDIPFLKVPDMHGRSIVIKTEDNLSITGADLQSKKYIPKWSTCVSCIATVGVVSLAGERLQTNQQINSIIPKNRNYTFFNYYLIKSKAEHLKTMASSGSATPNLNKGHFEKIGLKIPPIEILEKFQSEIEGVFKMIDDNMRQIQTLNSLRDTLLPRLLSGKIDINER